jgi:hypothetical protein
MSRVSSSLVLSLLNRIISRAVSNDHNYTYMVEVKTKQKIGSRPKPYRPAISVKRVPSERLIDDLEKGDLSGVTLTKRVVFYSGPGRDGLVKHQEQRITISINPGRPPAVAQLMRGIEALAKEQQYESVTFHIDNLPHNQSSNPTIPLDDQEALEHLYNRAKVITQFGGTLLESCYPSICTAIQQEMISVLNSEHGW